MFKERVPAQKNGLMVDNLLNFDNTYLSLHQIFYSMVQPSVVPNPEIVLFNEELGQNLFGSSTNPQEWSELLSGNRVPESTAPFAQAYAGHQFGHFTMLGDGRAIVIGEHITPFGERYDIQLKGCGRTPYSRRGDGKATLGAMLREYLMSESMFYLGIPTSRSLAVTKTGEKVYRDKTFDGAVLTRLMTSHIRVGTFEYARYYGSPNDLESLLDYTIKRHLPSLLQSKNPAAGMLEYVMNRQIELIINWMRVGFIHGVMNTDNTSISGETFDYGPCSFMNAFDLNTVFSSLDTGGRYAFGNQPAIIKWNIAKLAEALLPLLHPQQDRAIEIANEIIDKFDNQFSHKWYTMMFSKIGLVNPTTEDRVLVDELLTTMKSSKLDYTNTFSALKKTITPKESQPNQSNQSNQSRQLDPLNSWMTNWTRRLEESEGGFLAAVGLMEKMNPLFIPRNYFIEKALAGADENDYTLFNQLLSLVKQPYSLVEQPYSLAEQPYSLADDIEKYSSVPNNYDKNYKTYCGT
ncbi:MAG: YdiU family protein [Bacteroidales bacterium]|nr:YdiU family protein [Bacteroidales bacterium]